jgi:hypothetical protein
VFAAVNEPPKGAHVTEREVARQTAELLRGIIRSIDKKLEYSLMDQTEEGRFALRLATRGREGIVSLRTDDLRAAVETAASKNAIRQKIKSKRDHLLSNYVVDVVDKKIARLLKQSAPSRDDTKFSFYRRPPMGRRR